MKYTLTVNDKFQGNFDLFHIAYNYYKNNFLSGYDVFKIENKEESNVAKNKNCSCSCSKKCSK